MNRDLEGREAGWAAGCFSFRWAQAGGKCAAGGLKGGCAPGGRLSPGNRTTLQGWKVKEQRGKRALVGAGKRSCYLRGPIRWYQSLSSNTQ